MGIVVRNEGSKVNSDINVTPMVDVMLVLLIIFMVITPLLENKVQVDLVHSRNAIPMEDASKSDAEIVAITRDNKVFLGQNEVSLSQLGQDVQNDLQNRTNKIVFFRADARSGYGTVMDAIDAVRTAGVQQVAMLTDQQAAPVAQTSPAGE
ncbi:MULTISPECIES: biopolymer transporter ExbD [Acidobacterium]|uniref:Transport energizing protein, ExbD/TolR family n=1 Tax=Acidobacterium capsulatum (strain ATCC 51196 / DSM 11244 / BCRC 80197 / JCM 7670 / NBRC 15755 / NCIMB 13165 / 161) TaxID=240015 RepID=C1F9I0_ACIC5|nr:MULTISPECIES: biopolymer transporter ExbD [Acidobacterium]ACO32642.1 transport energizing protein, ExbD/TolR family [Acidobacterium capsulatum ATCC 51196]HCT62190.1 biopolymer transporter ExbD [Acidobacterium sp.]